MRKFVLLLCSLFLLAACSPPDGNHDRPEPDLPDGSKLEMVISDLNNLMGDLFGPSTRSGNGIASITPVGAPTTRSADEEPFAYVVNFESNGFAVISTHPSMEDIISVSNSGSMDPERFNALVAERLAILENMPPMTRSGGGVIDDDDDEPDDPDDWTYGDEWRQPSHVVTTFPNDPPNRIPPGMGGPGDEFTADYIAESMYLQRYKQNPEDELAIGGQPYPSVEWSPWESTGGVPPFVRTKWTQWFPYNLSCPNEYPAGCVPIACCQIAAYHRVPATDNMVEIISNFGVWDGWLREPASDRQRVADFVRWVGDEVEVTYSENGSGAKTRKAKKFLKNHVKCKNIGRHCFDLKRVKGRLEYGIPVYMDGYTIDHEGHAWIVDGYITQYRHTVSAPKQINETRTLIHVNWGWHGTSDGYYNPRAFNTRYRADYIEEGIGDIRGSNSSYYFDRNFSILTWSDPNWYQ